MASRYLAASLAGVGLWAALLASEATPAEPPPADPAATSVDTADRLETAPLNLGTNREKKELGQTGYEFSSLLGQSLAAVLVILAVGAAGLYVLKRLLPRLGVSTGRRINVLETVYLGPRKTLHLVRVGDRTLLVAGARERLSMLTDVTGSVSIDEAGDTEATAPRAKFVLPEEAPEEE